MPQPLQKVLRELRSELENQEEHSLFGTITEDACVLHLAVSDQTRPALLTRRVVCALSPPVSPQTLLGHSSEV